MNDAISANSTRMSTRFDAERHALCCLDLVKLPSNNIKNVTNKHGCL